MAFDEDAVKEAIARLKPTLDDLEARLSALEAGGFPGEAFDVVEYVAKYANDTTKVYRKVD